MKGNTSRPDRWPALLLAGGYLASATAVFGFVAALGAGLLGPWRSHLAIWVSAAVVLGLFLLADAELFGLRTPTWRRQTPKWFSPRFGARRSALFWGLDAGLVATTFRITSLSWAALTLTLLGLLPWWTGAIYALGFVIPELLFDLVVPRRRAEEGTADPEPVWLLLKLIRARALMRPVSIALLGAASLWAAAIAITSG